MTVSDDMGKPAAPAVRDGKSEVLCSVALLADVRFAEAPAMLAALREFLDARFRHWDLLCLAPANTRGQFPAVCQALSQMADLRFLLVRSDLDRYALIPLAMDQAIGDFVLVVTDEEFESVDPGAMWDAADAAGDSVYLVGGHVRLIGQALAAGLSWITGFSAEPRILRSAGHFRQRISWLMARTDRNLAFRFPHMWLTAGDGVRLLSVPAGGPGGASGPRRTALQRALTAADLVSHAAPRLLKLVAVTSLIGVGGSIAYFVYALVIWAVRMQLAEGWLSTSLAISGSTGFLCGALGCIALGVARILDIQLAHASDDIVHQSGGIEGMARPQPLNVVAER